MTTRAAGLVTSSSRQTIESLPTQASACTSCTCIACAYIVIDYTWRYFLPHNFKIVMGKYKSPHITCNRRFGVHLIMVTRALSYFSVKMGW